jgi:predicted Fe-Mo cluster-binding NifX family protein
MRVCVSAAGSRPTSQVDSRFGRAPWFLLYDTGSQTWEAVANPADCSALQGAGIQAARTISGLGATAVITGHCGPKPYRALSGAGIKVYIGGGRTVEEALRAFERGELPALREPSQPQCAARSGFLPQVTAGLPRG